MAEVWVPRRDFDRKGFLKDAIPGTSQPRVVLSAAQYLLGERSFNQFFRDVRTLPKDLRGSLVESMFPLVDVPVNDTTFENPKFSSQYFALAVESTLLTECVLLDQGGQIRSFNGVGLNAPSRIGGRSSVYDSAAHLISGKLDEMTTYVKRAPDADGYRAFISLEATNKVVDDRSPFRNEAYPGLLTKFLKLGQELVNRRGDIGEKKLSAATVVQILNMLPHTSTDRAVADILLVLDKAHRFSDKEMDVTQLHPDAIFLLLNTFGTMDKGIQQFAARHLNTGPAPIREVNTLRDNAPVGIDVFRTLMNRDPNATVDLFEQVCEQVQQIKEFPLSYQLLFTLFDLFKRYEKYDRRIEGLINSLPNINPQIKAVGLDKEPGALFFSVGGRMQISNDKTIDDPQVFYESKKERVPLDSSSSPKVEEELEEKKPEIILLEDKVPVPYLGNVSQVSPESIDTVLGKVNEAVRTIGPENKVEEKLFDEVTVLNEGLRDSRENDHTPQEALYLADYCSFEGMRQAREYGIEGVHVVDKGGLIDVSLLIDSATAGVATSDARVCLKGTLDENGLLSIHGRDNETTQLQADQLMLNRLVLFLMTRRLNKGEAVGSERSELRSKLKGKKNLDPNSNTGIVAVTLGSSPQSYRTVSVIS